MILQFYNTQPLPLYLNRIKSYKESSRNMCQFFKQNNDSKTDILACNQLTPTFTATRAFNTLKYMQMVSIEDGFTNWDETCMHSALEQVRSFLRLPGVYIRSAITNENTSMHSHCRQNSPWRRRKFLLGTCSLVDRAVQVNHVLLILIGCHCRCVICRDGTIISHGHNETNMTRNVGIPINSYVAQQGIGIFINKT